MRYNVMNLFMNIGWLVTDSLVNKSIKRESIRPWGSEVLHVSFRVTGGWVLAPGEKSFLKALSVVTTIR